MSRAQAIARGKEEERFQMAAAAAAGEEAAAAAGEEAAAAAGEEGRHTTCRPPDVPPLTKN
jgi:hypothetical protein